MPVGPSGITRLNVRKQLPNDRIAFIRPMEGNVDRPVAEEYLSRLAASVVPIMKKHFLSVTALCDFTANKEFLGRNFNGGERIDLVLKNHNGQWYPFRFVQGVLIHELAHNEQMNHSKAFWKLRQMYHDELKELWARGYTGEGLWGRGVDLESGEFLGGNMADGHDLPEHLCGGTYRSSRKRRRPVATYKERRERRILKKFGANGQALGADEETKVKLERGKKPVGKPRVAGSARGRELRAAAALARFEVKKEEPIAKEEDLGSETESEDGGDDPGDEAIDIGGEKLVGENGLGMIKVCEDEDNDNEDARNEMAELQEFGARPTKTSRLMTAGRDDESASKTTQAAPVIKCEQTDRSHELCVEDTIKVAEGFDDDASTASEDESSSAARIVNDRTSATAVIPSNDRPRTSAASTASGSTAVTCPICSMENDASASTCLACLNVLDVERVSGTWKCGSAVCEDSKYINCADVAVCGVCEQRKD